MNDKSLVAQFVRHSTLAESNKLKTGERDFHRRAADRMREDVYRSGLDVAPMTEVQLSIAETIRKHMAMAAHGCGTCHGIGQIWKRNLQSFSTCSCVHRATFRVVMKRVLFIRHYELLRPVLFRRPNGPMCEAPKQEYSADFDIAVRNCCSPKEVAIHKIHHIQGTSWRTALVALASGTPRYQLERHQYFGSIYRIEARLGEYFVDHGLYPFGCYFDGVPIRLGESKLLSPGFKGPFLNGGSFQDFKEREEWAEQYDAYITPKGYQSPQPAEPAWVPMKRMAD